MSDDLQVGTTRIALQLGNIVTVGTEAIVNAANTNLAGGGGVDGAIHSAAGPELYELTRPFGGCPTGSAVITAAGRIPLPTRYIIHAVGPIYNALHEKQCSQLLAGAYRTSLELAEQHQVTSIAFPSISTGIYGYPITKAAPIAVSTVIDYLNARQGSKLQLILFVLFSDKDLEVYRKVLGAMQAAKK